MRPVKRHAVVDIGSGTTTLGVFEAGPAGFLDRLYQQGEPLQLMRKIDETGALSAPAIRAVVATLRDFGKKARELGAESIEVVATSAVRDARNRDELLRKIVTDDAMAVRLVSGEEEGDLAAHTVLCTLPVRDAVVVDMGGGSLQLSLVRDRRRVASMSFPLGALRLADRFLVGDPPTADSLVALRRHVVHTLGPVPWLADAPLVAAGGSARVLAKMVRKAVDWRVKHGHGYWLDIEAMLDLYERLSRADARARSLVPGLPANRVDSIVAVALTLSTLTRLSRHPGMHLSTYGIREGVAFRALHGPEPVDDPAAAGIAGRLGGEGPASAYVPHGLSARESRLFRAAAPHPVSVLLEKPIQGFWQEEILRVVAAR